jgi:hypothetical protein
MKILRGGGAPKYFLALKVGGALKVRDILGYELWGYELFKVLFQQGPGEVECSLPPYGLETH